MKTERLINPCRAAIVTALMLSSVTAVAAEEEKEKSPWTSSIELGFIRTTGNTETQTTAAKADAVYEVDKWRHTGHAEGFGQKAKDKATDEYVVSAERYEASGKSDYKFTERDYAYGLAKLQKDLFSGFRYEHLVSLGYGRKAIKAETMELDFEIGPGVRFFKVETDPSEAETEALLVMAANYWWAITDNSKFTQELGVDIGEQFTTSKSITGLQANINKTLALKITYTLRHKSEVPVVAAGEPEIEKLDTELATTLVYTF